MRRGDSGDNVLFAGALLYGEATCSGFCQIHSLNTLAHIDTLQTTTKLLTVIISISLSLLNALLRWILKITCRS